MKQNLSKILEKIQPALAVLKKYKSFIFFLILAIVCGFLVFKINTLNSKEPEDSAVADKLTKVTRPKINQEDIDKIQQLKDNSEQVKALFNKARSNPFQE